MLSRHRTRTWPTRAHALGLGSLALVGCTALVDTSTKACTSHEQCRRKFDDSTFCRHDGLCAKLFTDECTELHYFAQDLAVTQSAGELPDRDAVILGFMGPANDDYADPLRTAAMQAVQNIQHVYPTGSAQTLALLVCNDADDPQAVFRHLAESVRVPAVIGPVFSSTTLKVLDMLDRVGDTMLLSPSATAINFTTEVSPRLWRTVPPDTYQVEALIALYQKLIADDQARPSRLTVVSCEQPGWCDSFRSTLVGELSNEAIEYKMVKYDRTKVEQGIFSDVAAQVKESKPDVVIGAGIGELGEKLLPLLETGPDAIAPIYLFPEAERGDGLKSAIGRLPARDLPYRVLGTAPGPRVPASECGSDLGAFLAEVTDGNLGEFAYDAAFLLAYALSRSPSAHPNGLSVASAISTLTCKESGKTLLRANPQSYAGNAKRLGQNKDVCADYCGVSGPLDYPSGPFSEGMNREAANDIGFWCPSVDSAGGVTYKAPPASFSRPIDTAKPYYDVTSSEPGLRERERLRLCRPELDGGMPDAATGDAGNRDASPETGGVDAGDAGVKDAGDAGPGRDAASDASGRLDGARD